MNVRTISAVAAIALSICVGAAVGAPLDVTVGDGDRRGRLDAPDFLGVSMEIKALAAEREGGVLFWGGEEAR